MKGHELAARHRQLADDLTQYAAERGRELRKMAEDVELAALTGVTRVCSAADPIQLGIVVELLPEHGVVVVRWDDGDPDFRPSAYAFAAVRPVPEP